MKERLQQILNDHGIFGEEVETVLNAVHDMLVYVTDDLKENEPDAINTIDEMERAASVICDLQTNLSYYDMED